MKRLFSYCFLIIGLIACKEETLVIDVSGQLFIDCSQVADGVEVAFKTNSTGSSFSEPIILGSFITNTNGGFSINYEINEDEFGTGDLIQVYSGGYKTIISQVELKKSKSLSLYLNNISTSYIDLSGTRAWTAQDTLYYGLTSHNVEAFKVQPANGRLDTFQLEVPNREDDGVFSWLYYGVGKNDFNKAKEATTIQDSVYQNIGVFLKGCARKELMEIPIN